jgi:hypothetical protein
MWFQFFKGLVSFEMQQNFPTLTKRERERERKRKKY